VPSMSSVPRRPLDLAHYSRHGNGLPRGGRFSSWQEGISRRRDGSLRQSLVLNFAVLAAVAEVDDLTQDQPRAKSNPRWRVE
jgi:hypothetical protein